MAAFLAMAGAQVVGGLITAISSASAARKAGVEAERLSGELDALEANRQAIPNLSGQIQNQYANLQVATQGAEFQAEEADISLANTLDTLRATGMGAGGATALAQAALRSKREVGADIARQEARNAELRAGGAAQAQQQRIAQQNFEFGARENREVAKLDRVANQLDQARAAQAANKQAMWSGIASAAGAAAGTALGFATGEMKFGKTAQGAQGAQGTQVAQSAQGANTGAGSFSSGSPTEEASMANRLAEQTSIADALNPRPTVIGETFSSGSPTLEASTVNRLTEEALRADALNPRGNVIYSTDTRSPFVDTKTAQPLNLTSMYSSPFFEMTGYTPSFAGALGVTPNPMYSDPLGYGMTDYTPSFPGALGANTNNIKQ